MNKLIRFSISIALIAFFIIVSANSTKLTAAIEKKVAGEVIVGFYWTPCSGPGAGQIKEAPYYELIACKNMGVQECRAMGCRLANIYCSNLTPGWRASHVDCPAKGGCIPG